MTSRRHWIFIAVGSAVVLAASAGLFAREFWGTYTRHWTAVQDPESGRFVETAEPWTFDEIAGFDRPFMSYTDTYSRWGDVLIRRTCLKYEDGSADGLLAGLVAEGPMSASGKMHGHWTYLVGDKQIHLWYWYDEEVSEGEFAIRSNQAR